MNKPSIAIIRLSAMGDVIHSASILPALTQALKDKFCCDWPCIDWYIDENHATIMQGCPFLRSLIILPLKKALKQKNLSALKAIYTTLKSKHYDYAIDMQGTLKSAIIAKLIPSHHTCGFGFRSAREILAPLFYTKKIKINYHEHILKRNATVAFEALDLPMPKDSLFTPKPFLAFDKSHHSSLQPLLKAPQKQILCILEASKPNKIYPLTHFITLAKLFNQHGLTPYFLTQHHAPPIPKDTQVIPLNNLSLSQIKALIPQIDLIIGPDTGIVHLAWAFQVPSITLFGPTPPKRFSLSTPINLHLSSNPATNYQKHDTSLQNIHPQDIFNLALTLLKGQA